VKFWNPATFRKDGLISDCTDGLLYQKLLIELSPEADAEGYKILTLTANTDGVQLFSNSNRSIWPIFLVINELPKETRYNILIHFSSCI
jgi:hypothetical protein